MVEAKKEKVDLEKEEKEKEEKEKLLRKRNMLNGKKTDKR